MMEDVPMHVEEAEEVKGAAEELVQEVVEEVEQQQQEYKPYQLTCYYRNQLEQFENDYHRWEENQYYLHRQHFEETMLEHYKQVLRLIQQDLPLGEEEVDVEEFR
jgi:hypothetical protein